MLKGLRQNCLQIDPKTKRKIPVTQMSQIDITIVAYLRAYKNASIRDCHRDLRESVGTKIMNGFLWHISYFKISDFDYILQLTELR